jgi:hypothetical protein
MAVGVENTGSNTRADTFCSLTNFTITSADRLLVAVCHRNNRTVSSVIWDSGGIDEGLSELATYTQTGDRVSWWEKENPTALSGKTVRANLSGGACILIAVIGLTSAAGLPLSVTETADNAAITIAGASGGISLGACVHLANTGVTSQGGTVIGQGVQSDATYENISAGANYSLGGGSHTLGFLGSSTEYNLGVTLGQAFTRGTLIL